MDWIVIFPLLLLAWVAMKDLLRRFEKLVLGGGKLRHETGILSRASRSAELSKVQDVQVLQSVWQRMVGIGDIVIETAGEGPGIRMHNIDAPQQVADLILETAKTN
jgi:uncharacterized membrane protein YdbT with pleckstrin-like domain